MAVCPRCGANNADTSVSCWKCYSPLQAGTGAAPATPSQAAPTAPPAIHAAPKARKRRSPLALVLPLVLLLLLGGGGFAAFKTLFALPDPKPTATEFISKIFSLDLDALRPLLTTPDAQKMGSPNPQQQQALDRLKSSMKLSVSDVQATESTTSGNEARVKVKATVNFSFGPLSGSQSPELPVILVAENRAWKVDMTRTTQEWRSQAPQLGQMGQMFQRLPSQ